MLKYLELTSIVCASKEEWGTRQEAVNSKISDHHHAHRSYCRHCHRLHLHRRRRCRRRRNAINVKQRQKIYICAAQQSHALTHWVPARQNNNKSVCHTNNTPLLWWPILKPSSPLLNSTQLNIFQSNEWRKKI